MAVNPFAVPDAAWRRRLDETLTTPGRPSPLTLRAIPLRRYLAVLARLIADSRRRRRAGWDPEGLLLTGSSLAAPGPYQGVPLGGIGAGTVGRGWRGEFRRWQRRPSFYQQWVAWACQFSLFVARPGQPPQAQVLYPGRPPDRRLRAWQWGMDGRCATYHALYPRAWTVYQEPLPGVRLTCRQLSPIIPHNYRESSYPVGHFLWQVDNLSDQEATVSLMFTWQNGPEVSAVHSHQTFRQPLADGLVAVGAALSGVHRQRQSFPPAQEPAPHCEFEDPATFAVAALANAEVEVTCCPCFAAEGDGAALWRDFSQDGRLDGEALDHGAAGEETTPAIAVAATVRVPAQGARQIAFALAWDLPVVRSGFGTPYHRRYTRFYGTEGNAAPAIAADALQHATEWEAQIAAWQQPILDDPGLPAWYKMALFNELYYIADGGTWWVHGPEDGPTPLSPGGRGAGGEGSPLGRFAYLEGHEYRMLNTYDVHFYASFALAMLWPGLELALQRDIAAATLAEDRTPLREVWSGKPVPRKVAGAVPHDIGWPDEDPWRRVNGYFLHDPNRWKDLNPKFVLQVYRDFVATGDRQFVTDVWPAVEAAMAYAARFDRDDDGLIENDGEPDQTYDTWPVSGPSAYSGGLWLASLAAAAALAELVGRDELATQYRATLARGRKAYLAKLWNGRYFNYDASDRSQARSVMADQLAGHWYAAACGLPPVVEPAQARSSLQTIFALNVQRFADGRLGAVNGMRPDGRVDASSMQSQEVWTGVTYALAATMLQEGLDAEAWQTARGVVETTYYERGYWFQTPEAWDRRGHYRSIAYMRPLAIWAMQWAWERRKGRRPPGASPVR